jgi:2-polyprenyl-6-methoxyphenol hydroxylase-like FAD-dependent oxidoreductase
MKETVLISGAGVAGLALAYWLDTAGYETTIVELFLGISARRSGG